MNPLYFNIYRFQLPLTQPLFLRGRKIVEVDVPLLFEAGWEKYFDGTLVVSAQVAQQVE